MSWPWSRRPKDDEKPKEVSQPVAESLPKLTIPTEAQIRTHLTPQQITAYACTSAISIGAYLVLARLYKRFIRRIPTHEYLRPTDFRKRTFYGYVPSVGDGDNFHFFHTPGGRWAGWGWRSGKEVQNFSKVQIREAGTIHLRLAAIDAPEMSHFGKPEQPFAPEALAALRELVLEKYVRVQFLRRDQYDRVVGLAWVYKWGFWKTDVCMVMLKTGMAGMYEGSYKVEWGDDEEGYRAAEKKAKERGVGMWQAPGLVERMLGVEAKSLETPREYKTRTAGMGVGGKELRSGEIMHDNWGEPMLAPKNSKPRLQNEFLMLKYLQKHTNIPVPCPISYTEEEGGVTVLTVAKVPNTACSLSQYREADRDLVLQKVDLELSTKILPSLRKYTSCRLGGMNEDELLLLLPPRVAINTGKEWERVVSREPKFVLCHNDLSQGNIFIDRNTHAIAAIIDWEYAGYYPPELEEKLWKHDSNDFWHTDKPEVLWGLLDDLMAREPPEKQRHIDTDTVIEEWRTEYRGYKLYADCFVKSDLKASERKISNRGELIMPPINSRARLQNEFLILKYLWKHSNLPVPEPFSFVVEDDVGILTVAAIPASATMLADYEGTDRDAVVHEVGLELTTEVLPIMHQHTSHRLGGRNPDELLLLPPRVAIKGGQWPRVTRYHLEPPFVLCHNDLDQSNIFIDPATHAIVAIIGWEYAGYYPPEIEASLWQHSMHEHWRTEEPEVLWRLLDDITGRKERGSGQNEDKT
ncbi:putative endonuclease lcl3 [Elasticomyces elasticus]|uniref:Probable endonuclease LCL3 n=1 Tax=Elasticomyces elasticus TaxID=574655 RepID=A0AAN7ZXZ4_9PEZI|nr:putative endonuclease lcl3 [Elasticomyces elasticus]